MIVRYMGGLGNQLFQYAFGKAFGEVNNCKVVYDSFSYFYDKKRKYELDKFEITNHKRPLLWEVIFYNILFYLKNGPERFFVHEIKAFIYQNLEKENNKKYYLGYWHNIKYFNSIKKELRREFSIKKMSEKTNSLYQQIKSNTETVSVHVRRGDYLGNAGYVLQGMDYYSRAIEKVREKKRDFIFYVFSDDIEWCKKNFDNSRYDFIFVEGGTTAEDFMLMRACHNHIISNSTYSWWPAYLAEDGEKIAPIKWFTDQSANEDVREAILEEFTLI